MLFPFREIGKDRPFSDDSEEKRVMERSTHILKLESVDSTNTYAADHFDTLNDGILVVAETQTSGHGRLGRKWHSPRGNIYASFVMKDLVGEPFHATMVSSLAVLSVLNDLVPGHGAYIKWPNDIYWKEKKICGILIENDLMGRNICQSIAGIGININQEEFYSPAPNPVSLYQITGKRHDVFEILKNIMIRVQSYYAKLQKGDITQITNQYEKSLFRKEGMHRYKDVDGEFLARIICVEPEGKLILEDEKQVRRAYMFKEVEYLLR